MKTLSISVEEARKLALHAQGLSTLPENSVDAIRQLSYVQIDSISVAARAHHHVLFSRNAEYQSQQLDQMVQDKQVFEYWSHAAAFLPMEDHRFSLYPKGEVLKVDKFWFEKDKKVMRHVMRRVKAEGPLQSKDFEDKRTGSNPWFEWKPAKIALQLLFMEGKLMVAERQGFQKVYDLTERVLPADIDLKKPTQKQFCNYLIERALQAHGLATESEIAYLRKGQKQTIRKVLDEKIRRKELYKVTLQGVEETYYTTELQLNRLNELKDSEQLHLLSPFDNLVIQRKRLEQIFNFKYQIECYVPEKKRVFGYYTLPVLFGNRFVGRMDPKVDRKTGVFHIKNLWLEEGFIPNEAFLSAFTEKVQSFAGFCGYERVVVDRAPSAKLKRELLKRFKK